MSTRGGAMTLGVVTIVACHARPQATRPRAVLESLDTRSCSPTLQIPNRSSFAIQSERLPTGIVLVHLRQLPDAYPEPPLEVTVDGAAVHLIVAPKDAVAGTVFCDVVVRISDVPALAVTLVVDERNPATKELSTLGTAPLAGPAPSPEPATKWATSTTRFSTTGFIRHLSADGQALYWLTYPAGAMGPCSLMRLAHDATEPSVLAVRPSMQALALDATSVYVAAGEQILRVAKTGGAATVVTKGLPAADLQLAVGFAYIAAAAAGGEQGGARGVRPAPSRRGSFVRVPVTGGRPVVLREHDASLPQMAIDEHRVYFTIDHALESMPLVGGASDELAKEPSQVLLSPTLDDDAVYFTAGGEVRRVPKAGGPVTVLYRARIILDIRAAGGVVYAARNQSSDNAETAALVRIATPDGPADVVADLPAHPVDLAVDAKGVYVVVSELGWVAGSDRIVAYAARP